MERPSTTVLATCRGSTGSGATPTRPRSGRRAPVVGMNVAKSMSNSKRRQVSPRRRARQRSAARPDAVRPVRRGYGGFRIPLGEPIDLGSRALGLSVVAVIARTSAAIAAAAARGLVLRRWPQVRVGAQRGRR